MTTTTTTTLEKNTIENENENNHLRDLLDQFPQTDFAFAYGSGVFKQDGYDHCVETEVHKIEDPSKLPMVDLILCVNDSIDWHQKNLELNYDHYSFLRSFGPKVITDIQDNYGAGLYYNTLVKVKSGSQKGRLMKYGIISKENLTNDLLNWAWFYSSGRLQKPVNILQKPTSMELENALQSNLRQAVKCSLLFCDERFTDEDLFHKIAGLSYRGDFRMEYKVENPHKVKNIVSGNIDRFRNLYRNTLLEMPNISSVDGCGDDLRNFQQDMSPEVKLQMITTLPSNMQRKLKRRINKGKNVNTHHISRAITRIISKSSVTQGAKGLITAGIWKAGIYSLQKLDKYRKGVFQGKLKKK